MSSTADLRARLSAALPDPRQAVRVTVGSLAAFAAYRLLHLQQGYWAVFTVVIVMQGSIGSTLGAATDRLIGTFAGAVLGGLAAWAAPRTALGTALALALVIAATVLIATARPRFKVAPVTAAILILTQRPGLSEHSYVIDRVLEIALGGFIGVATTALVFPARSRVLLVARIGDVLGQMRTILLDIADRLDGAEPSPAAPTHAAMRSAVTAIEQAMQDAERERSSGLAGHSIPAPIPRTLWRVRNDIVLIGRALDTPLPEPSAAELAPAACALLRAEAGRIERCAAALRKSGTPASEDAKVLAEQFRRALERLRHARPDQALQFDEAARVFGLSFALEQLHRDVTDLSARIDELTSAAER